MKWQEFVDKVGGLLVIETEILRAGVVDSRALKVQISRWVNSGKLIQLKRGLYLLSSAYRKSEPDEFYIASILKKPSYISMEKALEFHGLIPEAVPVFTSVTTKRPGRLGTKAGVFDYRHIKPELFWGYESVTTGKRTFFIASAEKALLDFFYFKGVHFKRGYLEEMRLQNTEGINFNRLIEYAEKFHKPGILRAAKKIKRFIEESPSSFFKGERRI